MNLKYIFSLISIILFSGCVGSPSLFVNTDYTENEFNSATVGSTMMMWEYGEDTPKGTFEGGSRVEREGIRKELIYAGVRDKTIRITYREYYLGGIVPDEESFSTDAYARQSFFQNLEYTIDPGDIITFQDVVIEIFGYSSQRIEYRIIQSPEIIETIRSRIDEQPDVERPERGREQRPR